MDVTIAICTWNRSQLLRPTLERLCDLIVPSTVDLDLLVIDNNSQDDTAETASAFADRLPLRVLLERKPGLSNARNRAVAEARGDYIIWTDDDVLVDPGWLDAYAAAFRAHPESAIFGGPISPWFEGEPPSWLRRGFAPVASAYAVRDLGEEEFALTHSKVPYGANYAIRTDVQREHSYDPKLGRNQATAASPGGEEVAVLRAILAEGGTGWWVPRARVRHWIPRDRQTLQYLRNYYVGVGKSQAIASLGEGQTVPWRWVAKEWLKAEATLAVRRVFKDPDVWLSDLVFASKMWGQFQAALGR